MCPGKILGSLIISCDLLRDMCRCERFFFCEAFLVTVTAQPRFRVSRVESYSLPGFADTGPRNEITLN